MDFMMSWTDRRETYEVICKVYVSRDKHKVSLRKGTSEICIERV